MAIYSGFSHKKWWIFHSYVNVYQRVGSMDHQVHVGLGVRRDGPVQRVGGTPGLHGAPGARAALLRWLPNQSRGGVVRLADVAG